MIEKTEKPKQKRKPRKPKPEFQCGFCDKEFAHETGLLKHTCTKKLRDQARQEKPSRMAFEVYRRFYELNSHTAKTWDDFVVSRYFVDFYRVGRYIVDINPVNAKQFVDFLIRSGIPVAKWVSPTVYETYIRELTKKETPDAAIERNILLMQQWAAETGNHWSDFFKLVSPIQATLWIRTGRISPWLLYIAAGAESLFLRMSDEQLKLIQGYLDPPFWQQQMDKYKEEVTFLKEIINDAGV